MLGIATSIEFYWKLPNFEGNMNARMCSMNHFNWNSNNQKTTFWSIYYANIECSHFIWKFDIILLSIFIAICNSIIIYLNQFVAGALVSSLENQFPSLNANMFWNLKEKEEKKKKSIDPNWRDWLNAGSQFSYYFHYISTLLKHTKAIVEDDCSMFNTSNFAKC